MGDDVERTLWCGGLRDKVTEELLYELFLQAGPLERVKIPTDSEGRNKTFAFITFRHPESVPYTIELMNGTRLFSNSLRLQARPGSSHVMAKPQKNTTIPSPHSNNSFMQQPQLLRGDNQGNIHRSISTPNMGSVNHPVSLQHHATYSGNEQRNYQSSQHSTPEQYGGQSSRYQPYGRHDARGSSSSSQSRQQWQGSAHNSWDSRQSSGYSNNTRMGGSRRDSSYGVQSSDDDSSHRLDSMSREIKRRQMELEELHRGGGGREEYKRHDDRRHDTWRQQGTRQHYN